MQRRMALAALMLASVLMVSPTHAFHGGRWGCGWGGYRGCGWGGWGCGGCGWGWGGCGWGGSCGGYPFYSVGYRGYGYPGYGLGYYPGYVSYSTPWLGAAVAPPVVNAPALTIPRLSAQSAVVAAPSSPATLRAQALQQLLGLKELRPVALTPRTIAARPITAVAPAAKSLDDVLVRLSSIESRRKAERIMSEGDELFRAQNFHFALQKYKLAASAAPDLAEAHWRQGHALVATHNFDLATKAFKRAVALTEDLSRGGFRLGDLYGGAAKTKAIHLDSLAEWAMSRGNSPDPYFLLGLFLQYDGQPARAEKFFERASNLAGISGGHIAVFLAPAEAPTRRTSEEGARPTVSIPVAPIRSGTEI